MKILFFDIETSYNRVGCFQTGYKLSVSPNQILQERKVICASFKWADKDKVITYRWDKNQDDAQLLIKAQKLMSKADIVIGQNSKKFDTRWLQGRAMIQGTPAFPPYAQLDTLMLNRKHFNWNSYKLDYVAKLLGFEGKVPMVWDDWVNIVEHRCGKTLNKMCEYCANDVIQLEKIFNKIKPYVKLPVALVPIKYSKEPDRCMDCGSQHIHYCGKYPNSHVYRRFQCQNCGKWDKSRTRGLSSVQK